ACVEARLSTAKRKTHQPAGIQLAATPEQACGLRQKLNRTTLSTRWSDDQARLRLLEVARQHVGRPVALIIDDTGFIKKGDKSPGVQRQYCGKAGKRENCQLVVSTHLSGWNCSQPLQAELYLPEVWINDLERRRQAGIPDEMEFRTKPQIALEQVDWILAAGLPPQIILADAGYGNSGPFREGLRERNLEYVVAIQP
ncbi:IS701 family transposase, partial [Lujinxingia vulgaris]